jgi:hypothetical protein
MHLEPPISKSIPCSASFGFFEGLGFRAEAVAPVIKLLERKLTQIGTPLPTFGKVVVCSGHMIDKPKLRRAFRPARRRRCGRRSQGCLPLGASARWARRNVRLCRPLRDLDGVVEIINPTKLPESG